MCNPYVPLMRIVLATVVIEGMANLHLGWAQSPDIIAFTGTGQLSWTNSDTNLIYDVQWASTLGGVGGWQTNFSSLANIQSSSQTVTVPVPMFYRVSATSNRVHFVASVPKTGQTTSYRTGDDGNWQAGLAWPNPRFTVQTSSDVVLDNLTGLMWARNANLVGNHTNWNEAIDFCNALNLGGYADWRLPNRIEIMSLLDVAQTNMSLPQGHPFNTVQTNFYWSSTTFAGDSVYAWIVWMGSETAGTVSRASKANSYCVWPVRGGQ